jgi:hypothetical protein
VALWAFLALSSREQSRLIQISALHGFHLIPASIGAMSEGWPAGAIEFAREDWLQAAVTVTSGYRLGLDEIYGFGHQAAPKGPNQFARRCSHFKGLVESGAARGGGQRKFRVAKSTGSQPVVSLSINV